MIDMTESTTVAAIVGAFAAVLAALVAVLASVRANSTARRNALDDAKAERIRTAAVALLDAAGRGQGDVAAHGEARMAYYRLLMVSSSEEVQRTARRLMRTSWNVAEEYSGRTRKRARPVPDMPASKEIRLAIRPVVIAVRRETGLLPEIEPELSD
ncbi:hypothetical protein QL996_13345 [Planococcus sp. APC 4015]|nr:hypothetical protein [Planococcus sp. APC 4015]